MRRHGRHQGAGETPAGWFGLTVGVPRDIGTTNGRPYIWVGLFCSVACLAASVPDLEWQQKLAHELYQPVRPEPARTVIRARRR